tara:strand:+ start:3325 stop:3867 length:543 start_codon:yes stop_codon:yes gene_type:complete
MCDPTTMVIMTIASSAMTYMQAQQAADAQTSQNAAIAKNAEEAYDQDMDILQRRGEEEKRASVQADQDVIRDARKKEATQIVGAGESGVSGLSVDSVLSEIAFQEGTVTSRNLGQTKNVLHRLHDDKTKAYSTMVARHNALSPVAQPSFLGTALEVGTSLNSTIDFGGSFDNSNWKFRTA